MSRHRRQQKKRARRAMVIYRADGSFVRQQQSQAARAKHHTLSFAGYLQLATAKPVRLGRV